MSSFLNCKSICRIVYCNTKVILFWCHLLISIISGYLIDELLFNFCSYSHYLAELLAEHQKLGPFVQVLPICSRLLNQGDYVFLSCWLLSSFWDVVCVSQKSLIYSATHNLQFYKLTVNFYQLWSLELMLNYMHNDVLIEHGVITFHKSIFLILSLWLSREYTQMYLGSLILWMTFEMRKFCHSYFLILYIALKRFLNEALLWITVSSFFCYANVFFCENRIYLSEIMRVSGMVPNHGFGDYDRLHHRSPSPMSSPNIRSNLGAPVLGPWNTLQQEVRDIFSLNNKTKLLVSIRCLIVSITTHWSAYWKYWYFLIPGQLIKYNDKIRNK